MDLKTANEIWVWGGYLLVLLCGGLALWRGGWAERTAAVIVLVGWFLTPVINATYKPGLWLILLDVGATLAFFTICYFSRRIWTVLITANSAGGLLSHFANLLLASDHKMYFAYITASGLMGGIFVALSLGFGVWEHGMFTRRNADLRRATKAA